MEFRVLGPLEVAVNGRTLELGGAKQRVVLAELLLRANAAVSRDALVATVWGEAPPKTSVGSLQVYVHGLRRVLGGERIETVGSAYRIRVEPDELDLDRFRAGLVRGRAALAGERPQEAAEELAAALALWRGEPLADVAAEGDVQATARELAEQQLEATELLNDAQLALGRHELVLPALDRLILEHPYRERLRAQQMLALYRAGRQVEALEAYRAAREAWIEELGVEPTPALQELERAVLRHDASLSLAALRGAEIRLPVPATPLVGRRLEIAAVGALLRSGARLVTLVGPGGTGKTRLAIAAAAELAGELADGAVFVDLTAVTDPDLIVPAISQELGVDAVGEHLRDRTILLVLDNLEQILAGAPRVAELLGASPGLRVLATSRAPLGLAAEQEYPVLPLPLPHRSATLAELERNEAVQLFAERARLVDPAFSVDAGSAAAVGELCRYLDGLPLAIELAAARAKLLSPAELVARLEHQPDLLRAGRRDVHARHATLIATIGWSYDLLSAEEQEAFARMAVFAGGCTLEAAEEVCDVPIEVLASLVDNSLLQRRQAGAGGPRFAMLETVRRYALDRLSELDGDAVRRRHAAWLVELAAAADASLLAGRDLAAWLDRLAAEHDNIRAALGWTLAGGKPEVALRLATSLRHFWEVRGHLGEGRRWLDDALAAGTGAPAELVGQALGVAGSLAFHSGAFDRARDLYDRQLELARQRGDELGIARGLSDLGTVAAAVEDLDRAAELLEESADAFRAIGETNRLAIVLSNLGHVWEQQGDYDAAVRVTLEALATHLEAGDKQRAAVSLYNLGSFALQQGDVTEARRRLRECFPVALELGYREVIVYAVAALVRLAALEGDDERGAELAGVADELLVETGVGLIPATNALFEDAKAEARGRLGDAAYDEAHAAGTATPIEEALAQAGFLGLTP